MTPHLKIAKGLGTNCPLLGLFAAGLNQRQGSMRNGSICVSFVVPWESLSCTDFYFPLTTKFHRTEIHVKRGVRLNSLGTVGNSFVFGPMEIYCWVRAWCFVTCVVWQHAFVFLLHARRGPKWYCALQFESLFISSCDGPTAVMVFTARAVHQPVHALLVPLLGSPLGLWLVTPYLFLARPEVPIKCACFFLGKELPLPPPCGIGRMVLS